MSMRSPADRGRNLPQRWKLPLGNGAGNADGGWVSGCACGAGAACAGASASGGGAVVLRRRVTRLEGFGAGGAAAVEPSSAAPAAGSPDGAGACVLVRVWRDFAL